MPSYQDYGRMQSAYFAANPYTGPTPSYSSGQTEGGWWGEPTPAADAAYADYNTKTGEAWLKSLTPAQRAEFDAYHQQAVDANKRKGNMGAVIALGAPLLAAGVGAALGPAGFGSVGSAAAGGATSFPVTGGSALLADIPGGLTAGLGGAGAATAGGAATAAASSPWSSFLSTLTSTAGKAGGSLLSQLISAGGTAYQGQRQAGQYNDVINTINNLYSPDSPYAQQMQQALARKDSAAGRNSQYGSRAVELAAALTQAKSNALTSPGYGNLMGVRGTAQNQGLNALGAFLGGGQGQDLITKAGGAASDWLGRLYGNQGGSVSPALPSTDYDYWNWGG